MDVLARGRRLLLTALALGASSVADHALCACGPPAAPVGTSDARARPATADAGVPLASRPSPVPARFRADYTRLVPRVASVGHFVGRYDVLVWGNPAARDAWNARGPMPGGAQLVAEHLRPGTDQPGPLLVMDRSGDAWRFTLVSPGGAVHDGPTACADCHAQAPADGVFR